MGELYKEDRRIYEDIQKELETIKQKEKRIVYAEGQITPTIKPELWPKFRGFQDKIHPMTFLKNIIRLTEDITDEKQRMKLIQLSLEHRAMEWFEIFSDRCLTVEEFIREFMRKYWNDDQQDRLRVILLTGRYVEGYTSRELYACDLYNKCKHLDGISEAEITKYLLKHFVYVDGYSIVCQQIKTIDKLLEILRKLDDLSEIRNRTRNSYDVDVQRNYGHTSITNTNNNNRNSSSMNSLNNFRRNTQYTNRAIPHMPRPPVNNSRTYNTSQSSLENNHSREHIPQTPVNQSPSSHRNSNNPFREKDNTYYNSRYNNENKHEINNIRKETYDRPKSSIVSSSLEEKTPEGSNEIEKKKTSISSQHWNPQASTSH